MKEKKNNERYAVIFDTNAYRNLVKGIDNGDIKSYVDDIRNKEEGKKIKSFGHVIVEVEMLNHLGNNIDPNFDECHKGVVAMYHHCFDEKAQEPTIIPHSKLILCDCLFQKRPEQSVDYVRNFGGVMKDIVEDEYGISSHQKKSTFSDISNFITKREQEFADTVENTIKTYKERAKKEIEKGIRTKNSYKTDEEIQKLIKSGTTDFQIKTKTLQLINNNDFLIERSKELVMDTAHNLGIGIGSKECKKKAEYLRINVPLSVRFFQWICAYIVENNTNFQSKKSKHHKWNWLWDMQVSFCSGNTVDNRKILIVTDDDDIHTVVKKYGKESQIMTLGDYKSFVGF